MKMGWGQLDGNIESRSGAEDEQGVDRCWSLFRQGTVGRSRPRRFGCCGRPAWVIRWYVPSCEYGGTDPGRAFVEVPGSIQEPEEEST